MAQRTYIARKGEDADFANLTVSGTLSVTGETDLTVDLDVADDQDIRLGTGNDALIRFSTADASNHVAVVALDNTSQQLHITDAGAVATDWARSAGTHPEVSIHSNTTPATDYLAIGNHDGTTASVDVVGGTTFAVKIAGTAALNVTATAVVPAAGSALGSTTAELGDVFIADDKSVILGSDQDVEIIFSLADVSNPATVIALDNTSQQLHVTDLGAVATDWNRSAGTHPEVAIHSNTTPATDYLAIGNHDGTTASLDVVGGTTLDLKIAGTAAATVTAGGLAVAAASGVTTVGPIVKLTQTVGYAAFTDGGGAAGTYDLTVGTIPIGAYFLGTSVTAVTGFAGDVSAALTIGDGSDADRYNTSTVNVFTTAANGVAAGVPSGTRYHDAAATVKLTITTNADFTSVSAGSVTVELFYLT